MDRNAHLLDGHIDLAVRIGHLPDSTLRAVQVGAVSRIVCGNPDYFVRHGTPKTPGGLARLSCVAFDVLGPTASWSFPDKRGGEEIVTIRCR